MILQALYEYYQRKAELGEIAPEGFITKEIDFLIVLDSSGNFIDIESVQTPQGKKLRGKAYYVPAIGKQAQKHTMAGDDANLLWDKAEFVLGVGKNGEKKLNSFISTIEQFYPEPPPDVRAVLTFLKKGKEQTPPFQNILEHDKFGEAISSGAPIMTFRISGKATPIISETHVTSAMQEWTDPEEVLGTCLITGETNVPIELTHTVTKRVVGSKPSGANLVSFNAAAFISYGKKQSLTAPVSKSATAAYTTALQSLVDSETNRVRVADTTIIFWAGRRKEVSQAFDLEGNFQWFITDPPKDDPDRGVKAVKGLYKAAHTGRLTSSTDRFYVLGLAPNASRISVRFFRQGSIKEFGEKIKLHFDDFEIVRPPQEPEYLSLYRILTATALQYKNDNVPPNLAGAVIESILDGTPYPATLLQQCIRRIRAEQKVTRTRAAILKASINRFNRIHNKQQKEIAMALDPTNKNPGYRLGRLFAVLEKIQEEANPGINATIRDRFYGAASTSPVAVFSQLLKLKNHHLAKLDNRRRRVNFEKLIGEIMLEISEFPAHLTLQDQAYFSVGYYHQRQDFFTSKKTEEETTHP